MLDMHNQSAPINIAKLCTKTSHIHTYNTPSSKSQLFSTEYSRLNLQKKAFSRVGDKIWNKIVVITKRRNDLQPPKTTYNHLQPPTTIYSHLEKFNNHLKNIYNHQQTIEYHLKQVINVYGKRDGNMSRK